MNTNHTDLIAKLRYMGKQYAAGQQARGGGNNGKHYLEEAADALEAMQAALVERESQSVSDNAVCGAQASDKPVADDALPEPVAWLYEWGEGKLQASTSSPAEMLEWLDYAHVTPLVRGDDAVILISSLREHSTELLQAADHIRAGLEAEIERLREANKWLDAARHTLIP